MIPQYIPYSAYRDSLDKENEMDGSFDSLLNEAKALLTSGGQRMGKLIATPEA